MLRLPARLKLLKLEGGWETAEDKDADDLMSNETMETSHFHLNTDIANNDNAGTDTQDNGGSSSSSGSMMTSFAGGHPLQYPEILQHLFQFCPSSILATCRLVCKLWYEESLLTWRSSVSIAVNTDHDYGETNVLVGRATPFKEFLEFNDKSGNQCSTRPCRSIRIMQGCDCLRPRELNELLHRSDRFTIRRCKFCLNSEEFKLFWISIGSNLTTLTLSNCTFSNVEQFRLIIYKCCPILQKLEVDGCNMLFPTVSREGENNEQQPEHRQNKHLKSLHVSFGRYRRQLPVSWIELFSNFPSLSSLECSAPFLNEFPESEFQGLMEAIRAIRRNDCNKLRLKHFRIHPDLAISPNPASHQRFALVKELRLPLKSCTVAVHPEMHRQFLRSTLEYLVPSVNSIKLLLHKDRRIRMDPHLQDQPHLSSTPRDFPFGIQLDNVTTLDIRGDLIDNLNFLKYTPNLSKLNISDNGMEVMYTPCGRKFVRSTEVVSNTCKEELACVKMLRLTSFSLNFCLWYDEDIQDVFNWMPNVTNLEMVLNHQQFSMVCKHWKNLRRLRVFGNEECKLLTNENVAGIGKGKGFGIRPVIANLESLESLALETLRLTPESVYHLFLHLPNLQALDHGVWYRKGEVQRRDLDLSSYLRALLRCSYYATNVATTPLSISFYNTVQQWIAENSNGEKRRKTDSG